MKARRPVDDSPLSADEREAYEERAAIMEHAGGMPRAVAEREAFARVIGKRKPRGERNDQIPLSFNEGVSG